MYKGGQLTVVTHAAYGMGFMFFILFLHQRSALPFLRTTFPSNMSDGERLSFAFRCLAFSILPLFMGIRAVANRRFSNMDTLGAQPIAPVDPKHKDFLICQRYLQNTLEQTVLHIVAVLTLASGLEVDQLSLIPVLIFFFVTGRAAFFAGYLYFDNQLYRAFGFALTFIPSLLGLAYAIFIITFRDIFF